jgi:hypothetical protein
MRPTYGLFAKFHRQLSSERNDWSGSGPGLELYAPTGGCTSFSGHSKVKIGRRKPATIGLGAHLVQGCSEERTPTQNEVLRRGGGNHLDAVRGAVPYTGP